MNALYVADWMTGRNGSTVLRNQRIGVNVISINSSMIIVWRVNDEYEI
jgi:hypothetical protein